MISQEFVAREPIVKDLARRLYEAWQDCRVLEPLTDSYPGLTLEDAYAVQFELLNHRLEPGARVIGKKLGCTNIVAQQVLGTEEPVFGHLLDTTLIDDGADVGLGGLIQPRVEAEIAFILKTDLRGPGLTARDAISAIDYISPAIEIADSRIRDWRIKLADFVSDNASSGMFLLGESKVSPQALDLSCVQARLEKNGEVVAQGNGNDVLGNPILGVVWLANNLARTGECLKAGDVILSGSFVMPQAVSKGDHITAIFEDLGSTSVRFV